MFKTSSLSLLIYAFVIIIYNIKYLCVFHVCTFYVYYFLYIYFISTWEPLYRTERLYHSITKSPPPMVYSAIFFSYLTITSRNFLGNSPANNGRKKCGNLSVVYGLCCKSYRSDQDEIRPRIFVRPAVGGGGGTQLPMQLLTAYTNGNIKRIKIFTHFINIEQ